MVQSWPLEQLTIALNQNPWFVYNANLRFFKSELNLAEAQSGGKREGGSMKADASFQTHRFFR